MAVVCSTSCQLSRAMPEALARAIARRTDLFGYEPSVGDYGRGGHQLGMFSDADLVRVDEFAERFGSVDPLPLRADGGLDA